MPFESPFPPALLDGTISASVHEHVAPDGTLAPPRTIIRHDQSWAINVRWQITGTCVPFIHGFWHLHVGLESLGIGPDKDLTDTATPSVPEHWIPLTPPNGNYAVHFDVAAGEITAPPAGILYKVIVSLTYRTLRLPNNIGPPGEMAAYVEGPVLQFYDPD